LVQGTIRHVLKGHKGWVGAVGVDRAGTLAVSGSGDRTVRVWDLASGRLLATFTADASVEAIAAALAKSALVAGDDAGRVHLLRLEGLEPAGQESKRHRD
jgi:WD40 repeat protein